jgi:hypothetical protein
LRRILLGGVLLPACLSFGAATAAANPPDIVDVNITAASSVLSSACSFPIDVTSDVTGRQITFTDSAGVITAMQFNGTEQDVFNANGRSLASEPYTYNIRTVFDESGGVEHVYATGLVVRVVLPDGTKFLSAGRLDFVTRNFEFAITPDVGRSGDLDAFCAALSG